MTDLQAIVLGVVQGITEWLPISSTAHLQIVPALLHWANPPTHFKAAIQFGTVLAAIIYFRKDIIAAHLRPASSTAEPGAASRALLLPVALGTLPVVVCGLAFSRFIEHDLQNLYVQSAALLVFGLAMAAAERFGRQNRKLTGVSLRDGLLVGLAQAVALIPGASRSGVTMTMSLFLGLERATAARFSFLLSLPAITAASLYEGMKYRHEILESGMARPLLLATAVSFVAGWASISWLMAFLRKHPTYVFVVYRIALAVLLIVLAATGAVQPR